MATDNRDSATPPVPPPWAEASCPPAPPPQVPPPHVPPAQTPPPHTQAGWPGSMPAPGQAPPPGELPPGPPGQVPAHAPAPYPGYAPGEANAQTTVAEPPPVELDASAIALDEEDSGRRGWLHSHVVEPLESCASSLVFHLVLLIVLGLFTMLSTPDEPPEHVVELSSIRYEEEVTERLDENLDPAQTPSFTSSFGAPSFSDADPGIESSAKPSLDARVLETGEKLEVSLSDVDVASVPHDTMSQALDASSPGEPAAVVEGYDQAFDRLTQEILLMLAQRKVLLMWLFDESESMKDDQAEIRARIGKVYEELGLTDAAESDALLTSVASYGQQIHFHTRAATSDVERIKAAMEKVPVDISGKEMMCQAIGATIGEHRRFGVGPARRQMALVLVSDESGDQQTNVSHLEAAIAMANQLNCRIYILGREAVFGYPYAHMKWRHPYTGHVHWLPIDRGPETAFVEQLQTSGFHRRYDAHPSGFGSFEQARMAYETGGIFFMLPSLETDLLRGEKRIYELEAMRPYLPDLSSRAHYAAQRNQSPLRSGLWTIINTLNPYDPEKAKVINLEMAFRASKFPQEAAGELKKAKAYVEFLHAAQLELERMEAYRDQEPSPRWRANYDLIYAQVLAYKVRVYEYGAAVEARLSEPLPPAKPPNLRLVRIDVEHRSETVTGELTESTIAKSQEMFRRVIYDHPGTPWAARAEWELARGFGMQLVGVYRPPPPPPSPTRPSRPSPPRPPVRIPKL